ncbi:MAG: ankyrin repeat domain-containing protein, partial [Nitrososphaera sp.]|nr:ankyrin repeat domain-containing protein [Nitrososphaera sp.]
NISVLKRVGLADGSVYSFEYNTYVQVKTIRRYAPNNSNPVNFPNDYFQRAYTTYNLPDNTGPSQTDCPRFTTRADWAYEWNGGVVRTYAVDSGWAWGQVTLPDNTIYKEFFATSGWQRGLPTQTETWYGGVKKKWTTLQWTQDNTGVSYLLNPRVTETNVYDDASNRRRTTISYTSYGLPSDVYEYEANATTVLRRTHTDYNLNSAYTSRRIIGLPSAQYLYNGSNGLFSKVDYQYDLGGEFQVHQGPPIRHDTANYGSGFVQGRGNLNSVRRWDVTYPTDVSKVSEVKTGYNTSGSVIFTRDPNPNPIHQTTISYIEVRLAISRRLETTFGEIFTDPEGQTPALLRLCVMFFPVIVGVRVVGFILFHTLGILGRPSLWLSTRQSLFKCIHSKPEQPGLAHPTSEDAEVHRGKTNLDRSLRPSASSVVGFLCTNVSWSDLACLPGFRGFMIKINDIRSALLILGIAAIPFVCNGCVALTKPHERKSQMSNRVSDKWQHFELQDKSYWIAGNAVFDSTELPTREIYLFIDQKDFEMTYVKEVCISLAKEYPSPERLTITAFSSEEIIQNTISFKGRSIRLYFPGTPEGAARYHRELTKATPLVGYFRAFYVRSEYGESLKYSPTPNDKELVVSQISENKLSGNRLVFYQIREAVQEEDLNALINFLPNLKSINSKDENGLTPLMIATLYCKPSIISYLLNNGADATNPLILILAVGEGSFKLIGKYADNMNLNAPVNIDQHTRAKCAKLLLDHGAKANVSIRNGETPLMYATSNIDILEALLQYGADVNAKSNMGWTAVMYAAFYGHTAGAKLLITQGADLNAISSDGWTALKLARSEGHEELATILSL